MARNPHLRKAGMVTCSGLCSDASYILRSKDEDVITQEFLAIQLQTDHFWEYCESHKVGSVNFAINYKTLAAYEFELPPIETQKEISNKVWAAYRLKEAYKRLLVATDEMVKSQFIEMFGNPITGWKYPVTTLGDCFKIGTGGTPSRENSSFYDGIIPWVKSTEVNYNYINDTEEHLSYVWARFYKRTCCSIGSSSNC